VQGHICTDLYCSQLHTQAMLSFFCLKIDIYIFQLSKQSIERDQTGLNNRIP